MLFVIACNLIFKLRLYFLFYFLFSVCFRFVLSKMRKPQQKRYAAKIGFNFYFAFKMAF